MATNQPAPERVHLRYGSARVFDRPDTHAQEVALLGPDDPVVVVGSQGEFYQVTLPNGTVGFVYAHNLDGADLPLTTNEQQRADDRAAAAAQPAGGWRGILQRLHRGPQGPHA